MAQKKKIDYAARAAHRKNVENAAYKAKQAKNKALWQKHGKLITFGGIGAIVLIVLLILVFNWFISFDGHIPVMLGKLNGAGDNWIVTNLGSTNNPSYFKLGEFNVPEGYTVDESTSFATDKLAQGFYSVADDENAAVKNVYVTGVKNVSGAAQMEKVLGYNMTHSHTEPVTLEIDGKNVIYSYFVYDTTEKEDPEAEIPEEDLIGYSNITMYVDTVKDSCILISVSSQTDQPILEVPGEDVLYPVAEQFLAAITLPQ